jgi:hypothetical protein
MKIKFIFLLTVISFPLFAQTDSAAKKEGWVERWERINERQDTVERNRPKASPAKEYPMETDWGLCRVSDTMLIEQTEI